MVERTGPEPARYAARIFGRDTELAAVHAVLDSVTGGSVGLLLTGEAGIGKTTVWSEGLRAAGTRGYCVLTCRPGASEARLSMSGLIDLMRAVPEPVFEQLEPPLRDALAVALLRRAAGEVPADQHTVQVAVFEVIRRLARVAPVVLAVDDVQWLDEPSARVLEYVVRRLDGDRVAVLTALRTDDPDAPLPLGMGGGPAEITRIRLGALSLGALHRLVRTETGSSLPRPVLIRLQQASGGNPFYAREFARALRRSGSQPLPGAPLPTPRTLSELVADRIAALPEPTRVALLYAAALPQPSVDLVRRALGDTADPLEALFDAEDHGVVELFDGGIHFTHPLLSAAVYSSCTASQRRRTHRRLAAVVEDVESRARHLALASDGPDDEVAGLLDEAGRHAQTRGAFGAAAQLWELASRHARQPTRRAALQAAAGESLFHAGDAAHARRLFETAVTDLPAGRERASVLLKLALVVYYQDGPAPAMALCDQAWPDTEGDPVLQATLYLRRSWFCLNDAVARAGNARAARDALRGHEEQAAPDLLACIVIANAYFGFLAGVGLDRAELEKGRLLLPAGGRTRESSMGRSALRVMAKYTDPARARGEFAAELASARSRGDESGVMQALVHLAELDGWLGDWPAARTQAQEALEAAEQTGQRPWQPYALYAWALADAHLGELDAAQETAERGLALAVAADDSWVAVHQLSVLGFVALSRGDAAGAQRYLAQAVQRCADVGLADPGMCGMYGDRIEAVTALADLDRAGELLDELVERCARAPRPWLSVVTQRSTAIVRMARGDLDGAQHALTAALHAQDHLPMPFEQVRTLLVQGRLLRRRKEKLAAREVLLRARRIADELGAAVWSREITAELGRLGLRRGSEHDLTATESQIARLAAAGLSNREVAAAAHVTAKTVEAHLSRVYRKLGVTSRRELARVPLPGQEEGP